MTSAFAWRVLGIYGHFLLAYFFVLNATYLVMSVVSFFTLRRYARRLQSLEFEELVASVGLPPTTVIAAGFNEARTCVEAIRSILRLRYQRYEVMFVNDGSTDATLETLREAFHLKPAARYRVASLPTRAVRGVWRSATDPRLWVVDKENGGRADALNAGLNYCQTPLVCVLDADTLVEREALIRLARPFLEDDRTVAAGGIVRIVNGCDVRDGEVREVRMPSGLLEGLQVLEYLRSFLTGRVGWNALGATFLISGAFGMFRRTTLVELGGLDSRTVGEDMELVVRIHRSFRDSKKPYRITFVPDPVAWTECPRTMRHLGNQRDRWQRGLMQVLSLHRGMLFNPRYGALGMVALPFLYFLEMLGPVVEGCGYVASAALFASGRGSVLYCATFVLVALVFGLLLSIVSVALEEMTFRRYPRVRDLLRLFWLSAVEGFGYRQLTVYWRLRGILRGLAGRKGWGEMVHFGFRSASRAGAFLLAATIPLAACGQGGSEPAAPPAASAEPGPESPEEAAAREADAAWDAGDRERAVVLYEGIRARDPRARRPRVRLAHLYRWEGRVAEAASLYEEVLAEFPDDSEARVGLAYACMSLGDEDRAGALFDQVLARTPDEPDALLGLGRLRMRQGNWNAARGLLERGVARSPDYRDMREARTALRDLYRPRASARVRRGVEKEYDDALRDHVVRLQEDSVEGRLRVPWSSRHTSALSWEEMSREELNLRSRRRNYDVDRRGARLSHEADLGDVWSARGAVEEGRWRDDAGESTFRLGSIDRFVGYEVALVRDLDPHRTTLSVTRGDLLIKDFSDSSLEVLWVDTRAVHHGWDLEGPWRLDFIARHADYERGNGRRDAEAHVERFWGQRGRRWTAQAGVLYRAFDRDVAEYYSFDERRRLQAALRYDRSPSDRWAWWGMYRHGWSQVREAVNAERVTVSSSAEISRARRTRQGRDHRVDARIDRRLGEGHALFLQSGTSLNSDRYETWGAEAGWDWMF